MCQRYPVLIRKGRVSAGLPSRKGYASCLSRSLDLLRSYPHPSERSIFALWLGPPGSFAARHNVDIFHPRDKSAPGQLAQISHAKLQPLRMSHAILPRRAGTHRRTDIFRRKASAASPKRPAPVLHASAQHAREHKNEVALAPPLKTPRPGDAPEPSSLCHALFNAPSIRATASTGYSLRQAHAQQAAGCALHRGLRPKPRGSSTVRSTK
jgi:hypothetical protein